MHTDKSPGQGSEEVKEGQGNFFSLEQVEGFHTEGGKGGEGTEHPCSKPQAQFRAHDQSFQGIGQDKAHGQATAQVNDPGSQGKGTWPETVDKTSQEITADSATKSSYGKVKVEHGEYHSSMAAKNKPLHRGNFTPRVGVITAPAQI
ncbi:4-aminobutyrate aminotransferase and related aminotransferases [Moorella thermoacetica Y72]|uniref:4-aminobutyrate aminotransferase and related aminotransferases n=1 Tax=Moorella thermoacetica Y72 TaxID=1325331 RepID=A0A0S6UFM6_NEOTH|nr:4-aminobutyrate aminotransferase and related aminotransferases [Moorella thermoacetica Y72]